MPPLIRSNVATVASSVSHIVLRSMKNGQRTGARSSGFEMKREVLLGEKNEVGLQSDPRNKSEPYSATPDIRTWLQEPQES